MSGNHKVTLGNRGRLVIPAEVRERRGLAEGSVLVLVDAEDGLVLLSRDQLHARVAADLAGHDLVGELLADRRRAAERENAEGGPGSRDAAA